MGNIELTRILTVIEENFQKIFYNNVENFSSNFENNLKQIYRHFYNYLPTFFAHGFKGVALIFDVGQQSILKAFDLGVELGYFFQFGIFSYIMLGIMNQANKQRIKEHLSKVSSILQYLSFESMESMLYTMKTLNLGKLKKEFLMLTAFHGHKFCDEITSLQGVDDSVKEGFRKLVREFMNDLFAMSELEPSEIEAEIQRNSAFFNSVS